MNQSVLIILEDKDDGRQAEQFIASDSTMIMNYIGYVCTKIFGGIALTCCHSIEMKSKQKNIAENN